MRSTAEILLRLTLGEPIDRDEGRAVALLVLQLVRHIREQAAVQEAHGGADDH